MIVADLFSRPVSGTRAGVTDPSHSFETAFIQISRGDMVKTIISADIRNSNHFAKREASKLRRAEVWGKLGAVMALPTHGFFDFGFPDFVAGLFEVEAVVGEFFF
jgi:hypothetical protein